MQKASEEIIIFFLLNIIILLSVAGITIAIITLYRKKQRDAKIKLYNVKSEYEKVILKTRLEIQEQTSHDIARAIHDSIGHGLTLAKLQLNTLTELPAVEASKVRMAVDLLGHSIIQLSDLSKNLNAEALLQHGLLPAIEEELNRLRFLNRFELQYEVNGFYCHLEPQQEIVIYRIVQEGFQNILKHAEASRTQLMLHFHPNYLQVSLSDNGRGFDPSKIVSTRSTGLINMENRTRFLNGDFQVHSEPNKGTRIQFTIPFQNHDKHNEDQDRTGR
jgi:two-component system NarL family sensor kinase